MREYNLSSYEKAVVGQAILQRLNALSDVLHDETYIRVPSIRQMVEQEYETLNSAAQKLKIVIKEN